MIDSSKDVLTQLLREWETEYARDGAWEPSLAAYQAGRLLACFSPPPVPPPVILAVICALSGGVMGMLAGWLIWG
jgi:hypothetical protein